jgi:hypothetical protein
VYRTPPKLETLTMTITIDCPWCDGPVALGDEDEVVACDVCGIVAAIASDEPATLALAA